MKSKRLRQELGLKSEYAALVDLFDGKTYRLEGLLQRLQDEVRNTHEKGWLENRQAKKLEKEVLELDEKVGMVLMLQKGTFIRPLLEDGSVTPLSPLRIRAEIFYHAVPFTKILFMANLSLGLLALGWWVYSYVMQEGDKARNWRSRWRRIWVWAVWMACLFHWTSYLLRWYIGGRIPLGNGHETMLFLAGFLLLCTCIWQRRFSFLLPAGLLLSGFTFLVAYLSEMNPQITPLMPVLLSPWLSLHVSLIMVSYALFALMCLCSILALSIRRHTWQRQRLTLFCRVLLYPAVLCLGIGIFIGAVWANVSWGSYWAWDPKEVWALITFMLYGMAFHAKYPSFQKSVLFSLVFNRFVLCHTDDLFRRKLCTRRNAQLCRISDSFLSFWANDLFIDSFSLPLDSEFKNGRSMKSLNYALVSSLCALVIGILLVTWPDVAVSYLVITIGVLFLIPGLVGLFSYLALLNKSKVDAPRPGFPIVALGSTLFGVWLIIMPSFFIGVLMYVLGILLVLGGISQLANLIAARSFMPVPFGVYVVPVLILAAGITVLFNPFATAEIPFIVLGISSIVYALMDMFRLLRFRKKNKNIQDVTPIEEIKE